MHLQKSHLHAFTARKKRIYISQHCVPHHSVDLCKSENLQRIYKVHLQKQRAIYKKPFTGIYKFEGHLHLQVWRAFTFTFTKSVLVAIYKQPSAFTKLIETLHWSTSISRFPNDRRIAHLTTRKLFFKNSIVTLVCEKWSTKVLSFEADSRLSADNQKKTSGERVLFIHRASLIWLARRKNLSISDPQSLPQHPELFRYVYLHPKKKLRPHL